MRDPRSTSHLSKITKPNWKLRSLTTSCASAAIPGRACMHYRTEQRAQLLKAGVAARGGKRWPKSARAHYVQEIHRDH